MKNALAIVLVAFAPALACRGTATAVPAVLDAKTRATLYQAEARKVLTGYRWVIGSERPGQFVAIHAAYPTGARFSGLAGYGPLGGGGAPSTVFYLTVTFKPVSLTDTRCTASLVSYYMFKDTSTGKQQLLGPSPANSPEMTKYVQDLITRAEKKLKHDHPEYRAP